MANEDQPSEAPVVRVHGVPLDGATWARHETGLDDCVHCEFAEVEGGPHCFGRPLLQQYDHAALSFLDGSGPIIGGKARSVAASPP